MHASGTQLFNLLQGQQHFMVPLFQRTYSWDRENCESLWNDIVEVYEAELEDHHFLGSIVTKSMPATPEGVTPFLVIDGQQRLTTLTILIAALRDAVKKGDPDSPLAGKLNNLYLTNSYASGDHRYKVFPTQADRDAYREIIEGSVSSTNGTRPLSVAAYQYFRERIAKTRIDDEPLDIGKLEQVIMNGLELVSITLQDSDNEYRIFESLNATGAPLTQSDLLRNYYFMRIPSETHERVYDEIWLPMQQLLEGALESFFRYEYMSSGQFVREADVYQAWKKRLDPLSPEELEDHLRYLLHNAQLYKRLLSPTSEPNPQLQSRLFNLSRWGGQTTYPFLLTVYRRYDSEEINANQFREVLRTLESFLVRRFFVRIPTNQLNRLFMRLNQQLPQEMELPQAVVSVLSEPGRRWPQDEAFHEAVMKMPLYLEGRYEQRRLILETLEKSYGFKEKVDLSGLNIEHVMPQTLTEDWKQHLGDEAEDIHSRLLHVIGNLTLTGYNSELSNSPFPEKRERFAQSNLEMNKEISGESEWTESQIEERGRSLAERALEIWSGPIH